VPAGKTASTTSVSPRGEATTSYDQPAPLLPPAATAVNPDAAGAIRTGALARSGAGAGAQPIEAAPPSSAKAELKVRVGFIITL